jgi:phosphate-selective porin
VACGLLSIASPASAQTLSAAWAGALMVGPVAAEAAPGAAPQTPAPPRIEWRDGKTRITMEQAYIEISNRIQPRFTADLPDESVTLPGTSGPGDARASFRIRRAKMKLEGWLWQAPAAGALPKITYEVQMNWPAASSSNPGALLEDAYLGIDPTGRGTFRVLFGQFKAPFGRQELTSSGSQSMVDRALASNEYARGRDTGVAIQGATRNNQFEYRFGVFNGNGLTRTVNDNGSLQVNGRLMWQPNGSQTLAHRAWVSGALYSEADFESTTRPIYAFGLNYEHNDFHGTTSGTDLKSDVVGIDGVFKYKGVFATAEYYFRNREPESGDSFQSNGGFVQVGVMLDQARTWEAALRYGSRELSDALDNDDISEIRAGLNYYYRRHALKFQVDGGVIGTGRGPLASGSRRDTEIRMQAQFVF